MYRGNSRVLPAILVIIIMIVAVFALVAVGRAIFSGGEAEEVADDSSVRSLLSDDADRSVRMTVRGPIVGNDNFRSYEVEISPSGRRITTYSGYDRNQLENEQLANNSEAYLEFVHALNLAGFTKGAPAIDDDENMRGVCASGRVYTFELAQSQTISQQLWISSCKGINGTFRGDAVTVRSLFLRQIPGSASLVKSLDL